MTKYFMNIENGNIFSFNLEGFNEMAKEAMELYDCGDPTNPMDYKEYYTVISVEN